MPVSWSGVMFGRIERPERQHEREPAGKGRAARRGVAGHAIGGARQIFAARNEVRVRERRRHAGRIGAVIVGERHLLAAGK